MSCSAHLAGDRLSTLCGENTVCADANLFSACRAFKLVCSMASRFALMRKLAILLAVVVILTLAGCGKTAEKETEQEAENTMLLDNIYYVGGSSINRELPLNKSGISVLFVFVKFHPDNIIEWVDMIWVNGTGSSSVYRYDKFYGIYELDGRRLTITLSGEQPIICVVHNDRESITMGSGKFIYFDESKFQSSEGILSQFDAALQQPASTAEQEAGTQKPEPAVITFRDEDGNVFITNEHIGEAKMCYTDDDMGYGVELKFTEQGTEIFAEVTQNNIGKVVYIYLDNELLSAPKVMSAITEGSIVIAGEFTMEEAQYLAASLAQ